MINLMKTGYFDSYSYRRISHLIAARTFFMIPFTDPSEHKIDLKASFYYPINNTYYYGNTISYLPEYYKISLRGFEESAIEAKEAFLWNLEMTFGIYKSIIYLLLGYDALVYTDRKPNHLFHSTMPGSNIYIIYGNEGILYTYSKNKGPNKLFHGFAHGTGLSFLFTWDNKQKKIRVEYNYGFGKELREKYGQILFSFTAEH